MNKISITTCPYSESCTRLPSDGSHIIGHLNNETIIVYQAYRNSIADYAITHQQFGGPDYSFARMSWIKTSFLWMMFRSGWAEKEGQERILAISIKQAHFDEILSKSVLSSFNNDLYADVATWKEELKMQEVRLQWDPDHDPFGNKTNRRAIQLGLKGKTLELFAKNYITKIEDITSFVKEQRVCVCADQLHKLLVPKETIYVPNEPSLAKKMGLTLL